MHLFFSFLKITERKEFIFEVTVVESSFLNIIWSMADVVTELIKLSLALKDIHTVREQKIHVFASQKYLPDFSLIIQLFLFA